MRALSFNNLSLLAFPQQYVCLSQTQNGLFLLDTWIVRSVLIKAVDLFTRYALQIWTRAVPLTQIKYLKQLICIYFCGSLWSVTHFKCSQNLWMKRTTLVYLESIDSSPLALKFFELKEAHHPSILLWDCLLPARTNWAVQDNLCDNV